jgi:hypothetical protein
MRKRKLSKDEFDAIITEHNKWLADRSTGRRGDFAGVELIGFDLPIHCTVSYCKVSGCTVSDCKVSYCTVSYCTVSDCKVSDCKVSGCMVSGCMVSDCKVSGCTVSDCKVSGGTVSHCTVSDCKVSGCTVSSGTVSGGTVSGGTVSQCTVSLGEILNKPVSQIKGYAGLYAFNVWSVLMADGSRWVRMGCLFKSLEEWEKIGIRNSNPSSFPDDRSDRSEDRVAAFEFAKAAALRMKMPGKEQA